MVPLNPAKNSPRVVGNAVAGDEGVIAGQAMEEQLEAMPSNQSAKELLVRYHYRKMAALFRAACLAGAIAARTTAPQAWASLGDHIGTYYQLGDDIMDCRANSELIGKPVHQDASRLNMVAEIGENSVRNQMDHALKQARELIITLADSPIELLVWLDRLVASVEAVLLASPTPN